jgi:hypothetical protein
VVIRRQLKRRFVLSFFEKLPPCLAANDPEQPSFVSQTNALIPCARASLIISAVPMFGSAIATMIARITVAGSRQLPFQ